MPIPEKMRVYDPNDVARTTIKETNIHNDHEGHLTGPSEITVHDPNDVARTTIKETSIDNNHDGHLSGPSRSTVYDPNDVAKQLLKKQIYITSMMDIFLDHQELLFMIQMILQEQQLRNLILIIIIMDLLMDL